MQAIRKWMDRVASFLAWGGLIAVVAMLVHVAVDVLSKLVLGAALIGTIEMVSSYYMIACVFLPLAIVQRNREHIVVDFFTDRMSRRSKWAAQQFADLTMLVVILAMTWGGLVVALEQTEAWETTSSTTARFQVWPTRWMPVLAYAITALYLSLDLARGVLNLMANRSQRS